MNQVKKLRTEKNITQQKLSMEIHVSQQYISKIENQETLMTEDIIKRLAKYFHVSIAYLLGASDDRFSELVEDNIDFEIQEWIDYYSLLNQDNLDLVKTLSKYLIERQTIADN